MIILYYCCRNRFLQAKNLLKSETSWWQRQGKSGDSLGISGLTRKKQKIAVTKKNMEGLEMILSARCLKKNPDASRPSEHPPVRVKNVKTFTCCFSNSAHYRCIGCKPEKFSTVHRDQSRLRPCLVRKKRTPTANRHTDRRKLLAK